jgi:hypothetical protein
MAKQTGLGDNLYIAGYNISGDTGAISRIGGGPALLEVTGIDKSAPERIGGLRDGAIEFQSWFNPAAAQEHAALSPLPTADAIVTYFRGTTLGNRAASCVAKQINYDPNRAADGSLTFDVSAQADGFGLEWGRNLTAGVRTDTGATNGSSVDQGTGSTSFGLQAYLQVFAFTGTDATITIEESSDDGGGDAFAGVTGGAFAQVTSAPTTERIATSTSQTVERYLRVATSTATSFSNLQFAVMFVRNAAAPVF